jgi:hypothetical protein
LTEGGLYSNYESNIRSEYDLTNNSQRDEFATFKEMFERYATPSDLSKKLTEELLEKLSSGGYLFDEEERSRIWQRIQRSAKKHKIPIFGTELISTPHKERLTIKQSIAKKQKKKSTVIFSGKLVWLKENLPSSDVQDVKKGTAPTGGLRLTQANWEVDGSVVDQTVYFRQDVFGNLNWKVEKTSPFVEVAEASFRLKINGVEIGQQNLKIRHKPSGEAEQHNYTTLISWGKFSKTISRFHLKGKNLTLYAPPEGQREPFLISIE